MEITYIQFEAPKNELKTSEAGLIKRIIIKTTIELLKKIIPNANPDFDDKIDDVKYWLIECDDSGIPLREVGLDIERNVIVGMPFKNNYGYWTDNNLLLKDFIERFYAVEIEKNDFETYWGKLGETEKT